MVIAQEGRRSIGSNGPLPQGAISPHVQPKSAPMASGDAQPGVSRRFRQESPVPTYALDQTTRQSGEATHPGASAPTSTPSGFPYSRSVVFSSFATLPLLTQRLLCCIDRLNLQPIGVLHSGTAKLRRLTSDIFLVPPESRSPTASHHATVPKSQRTILTVGPSGLCTSTKPSRLASSSMRALPARM